MITTRLGSALFLLAVAALAAPAAAQDAPDTDARWLPWLGCWQPAGQSVGAEPVCILPREDGVVIRAFANGEVGFELPVLADGERHEIEREGCTGWESARWSGDAHRLYLASELVCEGGVRRSGSGIIAMSEEGEWLDIRAVAAGGQPASVRVRRYVPAHPMAYRKAGLEQSGDDLSLAVQTARIAAGAEPSANDVIEAAHAVRSEAVEALLVETGADFFPDAALLVRLDEAGVPEKVIDLMIALSFPERFAVATAERSIAPAPDVARAYGADRLTYRDPWAFDPWGLDPWRYDRRYDPYAYGYRSGYGYGWSYPGGYWGSSPRIIVIEGDSSPDSHGSAIKGRGYTRGVDRPEPNVTRSPASASGGRSSSASSGRRTAKPRDGGN